MLVIICTHFGPLKLWNIIYTLFAWIAYSCVCVCVHKICDHEIKLWTTVNLRGRLGNFVTEKSQRVILSICIKNIRKEAEDALKSFYFVPFYENNWWTWYVNNQTIYCFVVNYNKYLSIYLSTYCPKNRISVFILLSPQSSIHSDWYVQTQSCLIVSSSGKLSKQCVT